MMLTKACIFLYFYKVTNNIDILHWWCSESKFLVERGTLFFFNYLQWNFHELVQLKLYVIESERNLVYFKGIEYKEEVQLPYEGKKLIEVNVVIKKTTELTVEIETSEKL